jgi:transposase
LPPCPTTFRWRTSSPKTTSIAAWLEAALDLSFVRELVGPLYANGARPSVDPVVFFKLQLVMFFEDLRSERQLMRVVCDRLSLRW